MNHRTMREARGPVAIALCLIPLVVHAQKSDQVLPDGSVIHRRMFTFPQCLGHDKADPDWVHDGPCKATDIGFIDKQRHIHFKGHPTDAEICDVVSRLVDSGYLQR